MENAFNKDANLYLEMTPCFCFRSGKSDPSFFMINIFNSTEISGWLAQTQGRDQVHPSNNNLAEIMKIQIQNTLKLNIGLKIVYYGRCVDIDCWIICEMSAAIFLEMGNSTQRYDCCKTERRQKSFYLVIILPTTPPTTWLLREIRNINDSTFEKQKYNILKIKFEFFKTIKLAIKQKLSTKQNNLQSLLKENYTYCK